MSLHIELGYDHSMTPYVQYGGGDEWVGVIVWHPIGPGCQLQSCRDLGLCGGSVPFIGHARDDRPAWNVHSRDPLTLSPSLLCHCGDHGFIQQGRWVPA